MTFAEERQLDHLQAKTVPVGRDLMQLAATNPITDGCRAYRQEQPRDPYRRALVI